ncbi:MAG: 3-oxoacyl-ACP reductase FabG [Defluviitaleaceae bacterium]|nr:3-oxoacyl-ACP reductase FabG [Defluviitaleaceae bacterium]
MTKTVLITGSSRGIGFAIAKKFAREGHRVVLNCAASAGELERARETLSQITPYVMAVQADVSDYAQAAGMFAKIGGAFGAADILVNNAGAAHFGLFQDMEPDQWDRLIKTNLYSVMNCCKAALPAMIRRKGGCVVNISSIWGAAGASCEAVYAAAKGGVDTFTRSLAKELGPCGVRVNAIACGAVETGMNKRLSAEEKSDFERNLPLERFGTPEEIAELAYFLASDAASYVTGQVIRADGGYI